jgi:D-aminopeptidase
METAFLAADTRAMPDGTEGYEGTQIAGFRPAENRIVWTGDAGLGASLNDMIAWERHIDRTRDDPASLYARLSAPVAFADGTPAQYGFGLGRRTQWGRAITAHGGALRGWRSHRVHVATERVSVVVLFNHLSDAHAAAMALLAALLGEPAEAPHDATAPMLPMAGAYIEPETGLSVRIEPGPPGKVSLRYDRHPDELAIQPDGSAGTDGPRLRPGEGGLWMDRPGENQSSRLHPLEGPPRRDVGGRFRCAELDAELSVVDAGGALYGAFSGFLGQGRMELLDHVAADVWALPCPRALDHTPPGDWTLAFRRDDAGRVVSVRVGCWLARNLVYDRLG